MRGFAQDGTGVGVDLSDARSLRAEYPVGGDGGRSLIPEAAGVEFSGWAPTTSHPSAQVEMDEEPERGPQRDALGLHSLIGMRDREPVSRCDVL